MKQRNETILGGLIAALLLTACGSSTVETGGSAADAGSVAVDHPIWLAEGKPDGAIPVREARMMLKPGDRALIAGEIGGVVEPFLADYAGFVLADSDLLFCDEMGDEHCPTPWDACCEDPDKVRTGRLMVQFVDGSGVPVTGGIRGSGGLLEGASIVVEGTVGANSTPESLVVEAVRIYR